jgi:hypothetical protein
MGGSVPVRRITRSNDLHLYSAGRGLHKSQHARRDKQPKYQANCRKTAASGKDVEIRQQVYQILCCASVMSEIGAMRGS